ncbi:MAG: hypothetical protein KKH44_01475 [Bacteroidetes bacterium]|nr:hypothetical protein [Bacteroidota bacterium]
MITIKSPVNIYFNIDGIRNPVFAARLYFKALEVTIDEESFDDVAFLVGDIECKDGFLVDSINAIQKLCEMGNFQVWYEKGKVVAKR